MPATHPANSEPMYTHRGLIFCLMANRMASKRHSAPTVMYAYPRKGFLPPIQLVVDTTNDFLPSKGVTLKSAVAGRESPRNVQTNKKHT